MPVTAALTPTDWQDLAACVDSDPGRFFSTDEEEIRAALALCAACPVREACLEHALSHGERYGVWGGMRESERAQLTRRRRRVA